MLNGNKNVEGKPLRLHDLDIEALALMLHEKGIRTSQGKVYQPLHEGHLAVLNDDARFKVLACGRRWGKSLIVSLMALATLFQLRRRVWIVAPDFSLTEKVFRELYHILVTQMGVIIPGKKGKARSQKGDYYLETPWGSVLECKSLQNPDSLAGEANDLVIADEAALCNDIEDIWTQMIQPTLMDKEGSALFISTPRGKNQFYKLFLFGQKGLAQKTGKVKIQKDETGIDDDMTEWSCFQRTSYDNPLLSSTPEKSKEEVDKAYKRAVYSGQTIKFEQEYLASFEAVSDIVFPGFKTEVTETVKYSNVINYDYHPDEGPVYAGCDFNFAKPASTLFLQVNKNNDVVVFDERFTLKTNTYMQAQQIKEKNEEIQKIARSLHRKGELVDTHPKEVFIEDVIADISGDQYQLNGRKAWDDMEEVLGYRPKGLKQDRETGCNLVRLWLQFPEFGPKGEPLKNERGEYVTMPKLFISANCTNLIYALSTAKFRKTINGALKEDYEEVKEGYEGLLDALRYALVYLFHDRGQTVKITGGF